MTAGVSVIKATLEQNSEVTGMDWARSVKAILQFYMGFHQLYPRLYTANVGDSNAATLTVRKATQGIVNYQKRNRNLLGVSTTGCSV